MSADVPRPAGFSLTLLGGCALDGPAGPVGGRVTQRRRLAVLAVVAASGRGGVSRDRLLALLWPESTTESARHRLADTLSVLRATLGETALRGVGDRVALNADVVDCDVRRFAEAVRQGDQAAAAAAYGGPFLDGFSVADAPEFDRWVDEERAVLARRHVDALAALTRAARNAGDGTATLQWARAWAAADPLDARAAVALIEALAAAHDATGAARAARVHEALVREQLGVAPDPSVAAAVARTQRPATVAPIADVRAAGPETRAAAQDAAATPGPAVPLSPADAGRPAPSATATDSSSPDPFDAPSGSALGMSGSARSGSGLPAAPRSRPRLRPWLAVAVGASLAVIVLTAVAPRLTARHAAPGRSDARVLIAPAGQPHRRPGLRRARPSGGGLERAGAERDRTRRGRADDHRRGVRALRRLDGRTSRR
jgi:DNA-binding SARP family transcriptional activator